MPKPKQTKATKKPDQRKKIKVIVVVLIVTLAGILSVAFVDARNKSYVQEEKNMLIQSSIELDNVFNDFSTGLAYEQKDKIKSPNTCSTNGVKYSKDYVCGNSYEVSVLNVSEAQYRELNTSLIEMIKSNGKFKVMDVQEPEYSESTGKLVGSSGSLFADTEMTCLTVSYYNPVNQIARFTANCKYTVGEQLFPLN